MSMTISQGYMDASRWYGMAASMYDFLDRWSQLSEQSLQVPKATFSAAERFFSHTIRAISYDYASEFPFLPMANVSNFSIALSVAITINAVTEYDMPKLKSTFQGYLTCLRDIESGKQKDQLSKETISELTSFFRELYHRGDTERYTSFSRTA